MVRAHGRGLHGALVGYWATPEIGAGGAFETSIAEVWIAEVWIAEVWIAEVWIAEGSIAEGTIAYFTTKRAL